MFVYGSDLHAAALAHELPRSSSKTDCHSH
jgi:hypothetical protein